MLPDPDSSKGKGTHLVPCDVSEEGKPLVEHLHLSSQLSAAGATYDDVLSAILRPQPTGCGRIAQER